MRAADRHVLNRFLLKAVLLAGFALLRWREGSWRIAAVLFLSAALLNVLIALAKGDRLARARLSYWDEAAAFLILGCVAVAASAGRL